MSHKRETPFKLKIEQIDSIAKQFNWLIAEKKGDDLRVYERGNLKVKFTKISPFGYKVMRYKGNYLVYSDSASHKEMALTLLGETLSFEKWW